MWLQFVRTGRPDLSQIVNGLHYFEGIVETERAENGGCHFDEIRRTCILVVLKIEALHLQTD